jgi:hypothetical protein
VCVLALAVSTAWAAPTIEIPAEVKAEPGSWVVVSPKTDAASVVYVGLDGLAAFPSSELKDPRKLVVNPSKAGRFRFVAVGTLKDEQATAAFTIVVGDAPPVPPGPGPVLPDGAMGLRKASRDGAAKVGDKTGAKKLATAQRSVASAVMAGGLTTPADILAAWREANRAAVDGVAWKPWADGVTPMLSKLYADGKLADKTAWSAAFTELATGLED